ncbi:RNA polymerase-binding protein DksA [Ramlibacter sp.]|uniref:RNA polymerase-binding protein DksA n=1 Tax=Ramlibacter sp. TaxID=1917967 RepID=UPI0035AD992D
MKAQTKAAAKAPVAAKAKPAAKAAVKQPAAKAPVKAVAKPAAKAPAKPVARPAAPAKAAPVAKAPVAKPAAPVRPAPVKAAAPAKAAAPVPVPPVARTVAASPKAPAAASQPPAAAPVAPAAAAVPMAAKASYIPMPTPHVITPPPAGQVKKDPKLANNWKTKSAEELSDAEVLAMPDTEYMNDKQMAFFRLKLQQLKQDILNSAGETTEHLREDTVIVPDPADRATIEEEHALELRTRDRERKLLKKIEQSIARIDAGDYGYCDETGEPIGVGRLLARPTATLSLEAQQRRELKQKMFGD